MLLLIDNYDSFTYNLYQYLCELGEEVEVFRNDKIGAGGHRLDGAGAHRHLAGAVLAEGGGDQRRADPALRGKVPMLGVCLGHQCIGEAFGGVVAGAGEIKHGKMSQITHDGKGVFAGLPNPFEAVRYHSLAIMPETLPDVLEVTARSESGVIMGVRHKQLTLEGVQFHPESILTKPGKQLLANFLRM